MPFVELTVPSLKARQLLAKRVIDLAASVSGLILLSPLFALLAVAIKLDSPGPVFFTQNRVGLGGRVFRFVKFRTMRDGADAEKADMAHLNHTGDPRLFKIPDDPRVTRLGAFLRRWSLDELPQLWNVVIGDMSLVGPRPFFESDLEAYRDHHFIRLGARPGLTGLWQVKGRSSVLDFEEVVRLDREYIDGWSLWLDLKILLLTIPAVARRTGAF
jgi:lipopolysaccharide/colanic/teichoic acid biosynthesis glycosyltransferase